MRALIFLLIAIGAVFATGSCMSDATDIVLSDQALLIWAVVGFTTILIAVAYMAGNTTGHVQYTVFAKDELYHLGFSLIMLVAFSGILFFSCTIGNMFFDSIFSSINEDLTMGCYTPGSGMHSTAMCYANAVQNDAQSLAQSYIKTSIEELMDSTWTWSINWPLMDTYTTSGGAYKRIISNQYDMVSNNFIVPALVSISMQKILLDFIQNDLVEWIIPSAFVLRLFIPTRQMGDALIALVIGLYVLVPFMYVFSFAMYDMVGTAADCQHFSLAVCDGPVDGYDCSGSGAMSTCDNPDSFWNVAKLLPVAFFLPNLTIAVVVTFLGALHKGLKVVG